MFEAYFGFCITLFLSPGVMWLAIRGRSGVWRENFKLYNLKGWSVFFGEFGIPRRDTMVARPIIIYELITIALYIILIALYIVAIVYEISLMGLILVIISHVDILGGGVIFVVSTQYLSSVREKKKEATKKDFMNSGKE